jgi:RNA polymerase sigma-70 factor, ECF subfamily
VADRQVETALARAIASLTPAHRDVFVLRDIEGLAAAEVAQILAIRVDAVKSRLHRARLAVRERLAPVLGLAPQAERSAPTGSCPDVLHLWSRHLEGEITAEVCARMEQHLARCPRCDAVCDSLKRTLALCRDAPAPRVPDTVQAQVRENLERMLVAQ